jgi:hypothetical protein
MYRLLLVGFVWLVFVGAAAGQHLGEISLDYSYLHYSPANNASTVSMNGGGGAAVLYFAGFLGIKGEFEAYGGQNINYDFPVGSVRCPLGCSGSAHANLFTVNVGPTVKIRIKRLQPFVEGLIGATRTDFYKNIVRNCVNCIISATPGTYALDILVGGGIDLKVTHHLAIRPIEADYFLTRFINNFTTGHNNQNNFRYQAGLLFEF